MRGENSGEDRSRSKSAREEEAEGTATGGEETGKGGKAEATGGGSKTGEGRRREATKRSRAGQSLKEAGWEPEQFEHLREGRAREGH